MISLVYVVVVVGLAGAVVSGISSILGYRWAKVIRHPRPRVLWAWAAVIAWIGGLVMAVDGEYWLGALTVFGFGVPPGGFALFSFLAFNLFVVQTAVMAWEELLRDQPPTEGTS